MLTVKEIEFHAFMRKALHPYRGSVMGKDLKRKDLLALVNAKIQEWCEKNDAEAWPIKKLRLSGKIFHGWDSILGMDW